MRISHVSEDKPVTPVMAYHGTNFVFDKFEPHHLGKSCRNPTTFLGFYFTDSVADAWIWAGRGSQRLGVPNAPRVIQVALHLENVLELPYAKFNFYLQRAKVSTMQRDQRDWIAQGYDGFTVVRDGCRWYQPFDASRIEIVGEVDPIEVDKVEFRNTIDRQRGG